jgi:hypothetical protein
MDRPRTQIGRAVSSAPRREDPEKRRSSKEWLRSPAAHARYEPWGRSERPAPSRVRARGHAGTRARGSLLKGQLEEGSWRRGRGGPSGLGLQVYACGTRRGSVTGERGPAAVGEDGPQRAGRVPSRGWTPRPGTPESRVLVLGRGSLGLCVPGSFLPPLCRLPCDSPPFSSSWFLQLTRSLDRA